jgi:aspartyl protease family protein
MPRIPLLLCLLTGLTTSSASGQSLALTGIMGEKALIMVDGARPQLLAVGGSMGAVKLTALDIAQHEAKVEVLGKVSVLRLGASPVSVGSGLASGGGGKFITIPMGSGGHFFTDGFINGRSIKFLVDTGASSIAIGRADADRMGIDYKNQGQPIQMATANGVVTGQRITLNSLRIGEVEVSNIDAVIGPNMPFALLGNNFLSRFKMERNSDLMRLEKTR